MSENGLGYFFSALPERNEIAVFRKIFFHHGLFQSALLVEPHPITSMNHPKE
jgi:hypothetical protein